MSITEQDEGYDPSAKVRAYFGGISDMTFWRWSKKLGFPAPDLVVNGRKLWRPSTYKNWRPPVKTEHEVA